MKLLTQILVFLLFSVTARGQSDTTQVKYLLNGKQVNQELLELINPKNIESIDVVKSITPPEIRITTKTINYMDYDAILKKVKCQENQVSSIVIDTKKYYNYKSILIDKSLIKKIKLTDNGTIDIRTVWYKERIKNQSSPQIRIRY
jgi:hypothetical protein